ncbi:hypothetical protein C3941_21715 [Kaistia algarum]|uniref:hypothetical protein n=1 Tax=Kaistia algarum TaxID=2083279 RepID=UPI000CE7D794|nr:hypothetical protein [Kaistia algarum]MCX5515310.1 hypothetical protein [Kaistia algarum]PPE77888.1 hypothetical protein C3941_21715 [Kaistia algarum]
MDTFRWIAVVFSMILGLGVARLLTSGAAVFRARRRAEIDWIPLVWAGFIFLQQITFWWSLEELATMMPKWTFGSFLLLVGLVLALFLAAALILPPSEIAEGESLRRYFEADGRWSLIAVAVFNGLALLINLLFWGTPVLSAATFLNLALGLLPILVFAGSRRVQMLGTVLYVPVGLYAAAQLLPTSY